MISMEVEEEARWCDLKEIAIATLSCHPDYKNEDILYIACRKNRNNIIFSTSPITEEEVEYWENSIPKIKTKYKLSLDENLNTEVIKEERKDV